MWTNRKTCGQTERDVVKHKGFWIKKNIKGCGQTQMCVEQTQGLWTESEGDVDKNICFWTVWTNTMGVTQTHGYYRWIKVFSHDYCKV